MKVVEVAAKSKEIAIMNGLEQLGATIDLVNIEVLSEGGLFSKCKLRMTLVEDADDSIFDKLDRMERAVLESDRKPEAAVERKEQAKVKPEKKDKKAAKESRNQEKQQTAEPETVQQQSHPVPLSRPEAYVKAQSFLLSVLHKMGIVCEITMEEQTEKVIFNIVGEDVGNAIGYRGETLDALQYLASQVSNAGSRDKKIVVDCENYREKRNDTLAALAGRMAKKATSTGRKVKLEPMNAYERRIIHAALSENTEVSTYSEGTEPNRYLVIVPKNMKFNSNNNNRGNNNQNRNGNNRNTNNNNRNQKPRGNFNAFSETASDFTASSGFEENAQRKSNFNSNNTYFKKNNFRD